MKEPRPEEHKESHKRGAVSIILLILIAVTLGVVIYLLLQPDTAADTTMRNVLLVVIALTMIILLWYVVWEFSAVNRLRRKLVKVAGMVGVEETEKIKVLYLKIYKLYMKLSEKKKQNFYAKVNGLREQLEEYMQKEKELERLLQETDKGGLADQEQAYLKIYAIYEKLSRNVQHHYYPQIVQLRDRLERGK